MKAIFVTNDRSEARVDPLAALLVQGQTGKYQAGQAERITRKQAGSERQAANDQERESTVQV